MRHRRIYPMLTLALLVATWGEAPGPCGTRAPAEAAASEEGIPPSLARYYPPRDKKRTYTIEMLELGRLLGSLSTDVRALNGGNDRTRILEELEGFARQYQKVAAMTPEWASYFATAEIPLLREAIQGGQPRESIEPMLAKLADSCTQCHSREMFKVQAIYHWPTFADVEGQDAAGEAVPFHETMVRLATRLGALPTAVRRADWAEARNHQREVTVQFALLEESCGACHQAPRTYFVDERVKAEILRLGAMVRRQDPDANAYVAIGNEVQYRSCIPCHQVHMPAAYLQMRLRGK